MKACLFNNIENIFIKLIFPKTKPITICAVYNSLKQTRFLQEIITEFEPLDPKYKHYIFGNFNINLLFNEIYIFDKPKEIETSPDV